MTQWKTATCNNRRQRGGQWEDEMDWLGGGFVVARRHSLLEQTSVYNSDGLMDKGYYDTRSAKIGHQFLYAYLCMLWDRQFLNLTIIKHRYCSNPNNIIYTHQLFDLLSSIQVKILIWVRSCCSAIGNSNKTYRGCIYIRSISRNLTPQFVSMSSRFSVYLPNNNYI